MSRRIKLSPEDIKVLEKKRFVNNGFSFDDKEKRKATLFFNEGAYLKMISIVRAMDKEVAWHGVAFRGKGLDEYIVTDILVYPQQVTGASVEMFQEEYDEWIRDNEDDERFYDIRMQGHSHVNMGTSPSSTDLEHQQDIVDMLKSDGFYIFLIWNKKGAHDIRIYDMRENVLFEDNDVDIEIIEDESIGIVSFLSEAKKQIRHWEPKPKKVREYNALGYHKRKWDEYDES